MWLLNRLFDHGDQPTPRFAFQGTVNWLRALSIYCETDEYSSSSLSNFYLPVQRRAANVSGDALVFECLTMAMHNVSALDSMGRIENPYPIVRSAIVSWYYATYYSSKAMLAASSGANPQTHASAGKIFQSEIIDKNLVKLPFNLNITSLIPSKIKNEINDLRLDNTHDLNTMPVDEVSAYGALCSYLKGTADYERWRLEEQIKKSSEYRSSGFSSFRSTAAKQLRDTKLYNAKVNYLVQAFRFRGKANYRDAIYLSYGNDQSIQLTQFIADLSVVSKAYTLMASHYISRRVVKTDWENFVEDIGLYAQFNLPFNLCEI